MTPPKPKTKTSTAIEKHVDRLSPVAAAQNAITAAAARLKSADAIKRAGSTGGGWQNDAWDMYDLVGEERFLADTLAGRVSQAKLYVGRVADADEFGSPVPVEDGDPADVLGLLGTPSQISQMMFRYAVNVFVAGEGWLVGVPRTILEGLSDAEADPTDRLDPFVTDPTVEDLEWRFLSINEAHVERGGEVKLEWEDCSAADASGMIEIKDQSLIWMNRVWRPHPRKYSEATSPTRASLPILREIVGLTMHVSAQIDSRLAGAGVLFIIQSAQAAVASEQGEEVDFNEAFIDTMITPIKDRSSAAAVAPLVVPIPEDGTGRSASSYVHYQAFSTPFDEATGELRDEALRRLALGQDAPPEVLLGMGSMNHWGAWLVKEDTITTHVVPPLQLFCDALTTQFLRPVLEAQGMAAETVSEFVVWYNVDHLIARPNRTDDALKLHSANAISDSALRREAGFSESDAPEVTEEITDPTVAAVLALVEKAPSLAQNPGMPALLGQMRDLLAGEVVTDPTTIEGSSQGGEDDADVQTPEDDAADAGESTVGVPDTIDDVPAIDDNQEPA